MFLMVPRSFLRQWRNKTLLVVGDSLSRNFFEALLCKLSAAGPVLFKQEESDASGAQLFQVESFNTTVGRVAAEFLVLAETSREALGKYNQVSSRSLFHRSQLMVKQVEKDEFDSNRATFTRAWDALKFHFWNMLGSADQLSWLYFS
jgi:hypothetical protein